MFHLFAAVLLCVLLCVLVNLWCLVGLVFVFCVVSVRCVFVCCFFLLFFWGGGVALDKRLCGLGHATEPVSVGPHGRDA